MKNWIKIFALTAFSTQLYAQKNLTIDEAVSYALENNVNVKKAKILNFFSVVLLYNEESFCLFCG